MQLNLDNLTAGLNFDADPEFGTPAGVITAVERRPCEDHNDDDGDGSGWRRTCHRCEVRWHTEYADGETRWTALDNRHLWTEADQS